MTLSLRLLFLFIVGFPALDGVGRAHALDRLTPAVLALDSLVDASHEGKPNVNSSSSGAVGANRDFEDGKRPGMLVEDQRAAVDWVQLGLVHKRRDWQETGWKIIRWGFAQQLPDGSFPNGREPMFGAAFFLEAAGRALLLEHELGEYAAHSEFVAPLHKGALWLAQRVEAEDPELLRDRIFGHRFWVYAAALREAAAVTGDASLVAPAKHLAAGGLLVQRPDGINPEKGGYDVTYQPTGLVFAARYASVADTEERVKITEFVKRGLTWLQSRVTADCDIDPKGSSRISVEHDRKGRPKEIAYGLVAESFGVGAILAPETKFRETGTCILGSPSFKRYYLPRRPG